MRSEKKSWIRSLLAYAQGEKKKLALSVLSVLLELAPFYCMYRMICLFAAGTAAVDGVVKWCAAALAAYAVKILLFSLSTGVSHSMAYTVPEALRLRLTDAPYRPIPARAAGRRGGALHRRDQEYDGG